MTLNKILCTYIRLLILMFSHHKQTENLLYGKMRYGTYKKIKASGNQWYSTVSATFISLVLTNVEIRKSRDLFRGFCGEVARVLRGISEEIA